MAYNLSIAVARRSGWRFILPADWVTLVFYAIGLVELIVIIQALVKQHDRERTVSDAPAGPSLPSTRAGQSIVMSGLPFLCIALGLVWGHRLFPSLYPAKSQPELLQDYQNTSRATDTEIADWEDFLKQDDATVLHGRAIYPVYFEAEEGMVNFNWPSFAPQPYGRLAFYLIGPQSKSVNLPMDAPPAYFPDGASVIVIGCKIGAGDVRAVSILIQGDTPTYHTGESSSTPVCPSSSSDEQ
jgi:hypothetical protein